MLKKIDLPQAIAQDYSDDEGATIQAVIDNSPDEIKQGLALFIIDEDDTGAESRYNYGVVVDTAVVPFEIATITDAEGNHSFFKV